MEVAPEEEPRVGEGLFWCQIIGNIPSSYQPTVPCLHLVSSSPSQGHPILNFPQIAGKCEAFGKEQVRKKENPHKVQIKLCCVAPFSSSNSASDVFITKPNVCSDRAKPSQGISSLKRKCWSRIVELHFLLPLGYPDSKLDTTLICFMNVLAN